LTFFDPACGCGNFLVISYRELRELELAVLRASAEKTNASGQLSVDVHTLLGVNVDQFYGIEIEEFPAQIAQVALWLMDHQVNLRVSEEFGQYFARIPLRTTPHVVHGNALTIDWETVLPAVNCSFVLGNPPFIGHHYQSTAQKADQARVMASIKAHGVLDFVANWYVKAADYLKAAGAAQTRCAFVSTNSINQGEQVGILWGYLLALGVRINFAHRTFRWSNEASGKAAVHCVIVGFSLTDNLNKTIYEYADINGDPNAVAVQNINPYLVDAPDVVLPNRSEPISTVPKMRWGNKPTDGGHLLFIKEELDVFLKLEPKAKKFIRPFISGGDFIDGVTRYCLWLVDAPPAELRALPHVLERIEAVRKFRSESKAPSTQAYAAYSTRFRQISQPDTTYLAVPEVSSERRNYIPIAFVSPDVVCSNKVQFVADASTFHFGILTSSMHNAWIRAVCGRMKSDYSYSNTIVYNNFPWPELPKNESKMAIAGVSIAYTAIETAAKTVLDERAKHQTGDNPASLADLYDPLTMPPALLKAHQKLDAAVDKAYESQGGKKAYKSDAERVAFLFDLYQRLTSLLPADVGKTKRRAKLAA
jgi:hypothetical protein